MRNKKKINQMKGIWKEKKTNKRKTQKSDGK